MSLIPVVSKNLLDLAEEDVEKVCMALEMEQLRHLCDDMERKEGIGRAPLLKDALSGDNSNPTKQEAKNLQSNGSQDSGTKTIGVMDSGTKTIGVMAQVKLDISLSNYEKKEKPWEKEEIEMLRKGMQKYPKGTSRRWEVISDYIGTGRLVEEILKATKTILLQKPDSFKAFDSFLEKRKPAQSISSPLTTRMESEGLPVEGTQGPSSNMTTKQSTSTKLTRSLQMELFWLLMEFLLVRNKMLGLKLKKELLSRL